MGRFTVAPWRRGRLPYLSAVVAPLLAGQAQPPSLSVLDQRFVCPDALSSDEARMASLRDFFDTYARLRPGATPSDVVAFRRLLLAKHRCAKTLSHVEAAERAVASDTDPHAQTWVPVQDHDGIALALSASHIVPVVDARLPEDEAVEAYARVTFAVPRLTSATRVRYDEVISRTIYFCRSRRYALVANIFFLSGQRVLTDAGEVVGHTDAGAPLYRIVDTPDGSLNARAAAWACATNQATAT